MGADLVYLGLRGLEKRFGDVKAVDDVSLEVNDGELVVLLGPSGCGKSTTLNLIAGFLTPDGGDISIRGESIVRLPVHRRNIGVVFQTYSLFPHMTVFENAAFGLKRRRVAKSEIARRVSEKLELVGLGGFEERYPDQLSGGQQQRVAIARALVIEPRLLLLDEPLSNLDAKLRLELRKEIRSLVTSEGVTTIFVTHDQEEALTVADRIGVMSHGVIQQLGAGRDIYYHPANLMVATFVGRSNRLLGSVVELRPDRCTVELDGGIRVAGHPMDDSVREGGRAVVLVRPEFVHVSSDGEPTRGENELPATLGLESFLGQNVELQFTNVTTSLIAIVPPGHAFAAGSEYRLSWPVERTLVYPEEQTALVVEEEEESEGAAVES